MKEDRHQDVKVSVVIPVYNPGKYFEDCIASVLCQTHANIEIVLVDDGSTDGSGTKADEFATKDSRIKVLHQENKGVSAARNFGIESSTGDYICFIDSDDKVSEDYVGYLLDLAIGCKVDISACISNITDSNTYKFSGKVKVIGGEDAAALMLKRQINGGPYNRMISRRFLIANRLCFPQGVTMFEDYVFNFQAFCCAKRVALGDRQTYRYNMVEGSATSEFTEAKCEMAINSFRKISSLASTMSSKLRRAACYGEYMVYVDCLNSIVFTHRENEHRSIFLWLCRKVRLMAIKTMLARVPTKFVLFSIVRCISPYALALMMEKRVARKYPQLKNH